MPPSGPENTSTGPRFLTAGDTALVVEFGTVVDRAINRRVTSLGRALRDARVAGIVDLVPTFRSLMVHFDPTVIRRAEIEARVDALLPDLSDEAGSGRLWRVPTLYGGEYGPDLEDVAERTGLSPEKVVEIHSGGTYECYMMGFMPGLGYLGVLPDELALPRRTEPRVRVPGGSVAIATNLTNIYTKESPGGWHLLGRTPIELFDLRRDEPILLNAGDSVQFYEIDETTYRDMRARADAGDPVIEPQDAGAAS
ncbi:MAG: 5-oxoprolinase subunit PxpB [Alphaproteobacteria bacterium]|nr:5-oxoprolinase subunit PxpB [Alphaproteobacteria bacterium]